MVKYPSMQTWTRHHNNYPRAGGTAMIEDLKCQSQQDIKLCATWVIVGYNINFGHTIYAAKLLNIIWNEILVLPCSMAR